MTLLSIVIPTKNRYETLFPVVLALTKFISSDDLEIVIQDNSDDNSNAREFFLNCNDGRIKYFYLKKDLSIKENTIAAIENAVGKYLIFIGDDDLVSPYICQIVKQIDSQDMDCLVYNPGYYWWGSVSFSSPTYYHKKYAFWWPQNVNAKFEPRDSKAELQNVLNQGGVHYYNLPRFYHGIVKKEVLVRIKNKTGSYLNGSSPDMAFAVAISLEVDTYFHLNYPVSIFGASKNSGGGWSASNRHYGKIEDQKHLPKNILQEWDTRIPKIWSEKTIYGQTVMEVLKEFGKEEKINYENLYATMLAYEPYLYKYIKPVLLKHLEGNLFGGLRILKIFILRKMGMYYRNVKYKTQSFGYDVEVVEDVESVMKILSIKAKFE